ncbi:MAG: hypothetical protein QNJ46_35820 [Leptolyngbyaceae cyanobacterium MO_188.B28]|nr:hypothetical protein [Leptolyngbyaceae cyanobacterium MO_188.B28]
MQEDAWTSQIHLIFLHPEESSLWLEQTVDGWRLPYMRLDQDIYYTDSELLKTAVKDTFDIVATVLYYARYTDDETTHISKAIYVLQLDDASPLPPNGDWLTLSTLQSLPLSKSEHRPILKQVLFEVIENNIPTTRPEWNRTGWLKAAESWIQSQLRDLGYAQSLPITCVKSSAIACVLKVSTTNGNLFFKAAAQLPLFCNEPVVTAKLADLFSKHMPVCVRVERNKPWLLLADFGLAVGREGKVSHERQKVIYQQYARLQIASVSHIPKLLDVGCLDRRLETLESQIDPLLTDKEVLSDLSDLEIDRLRQLSPQIKSLCHRLSGYNLPNKFLCNDVYKLDSDIQGVSATFHCL